MSLSYINSNMITGGPRVIQMISTFHTGQKSSAVTIPADNTIPQSGEGTDYAELDTTITPVNENSKLLVELQIVISTSAAGTAVATLFRDNNADAISSTLASLGSTNFVSTLIVREEVTAGSTSPTTFKARFGRQGGTNTLYTNTFGSTAYYGGTVASSMKVTEILP